MSDDDLHGGEGWSPEKEREDDPQHLLKKFMADGMEEMRKIGRQAMTPHNHPIPPAGAYGVAVSLDSFEVRAIDNGFIIRFYSPRGIETSSGPMCAARPAEFFVKGLEDAGPYLAEAFGSIKTFFDLARKPQGA
jgi:hypothetical protein